VTSRDARDSGRRLGASLAAAVAAVRRPRAGPARGDGVDLAPCCAYELQSREMIEALARDLGEVRARINGLLFLVAGAIVVDIALRLIRP
jgi:hypothetical protein